MEIDTQAHLSAMGRSVLYLERDGKDASAVILTRSFATTIEDVWEAMTTSDRLPRWAMPVSGNLELGGRFQLEANAGGTVVECEPLSRISVTWEFMGDVSWVDVQFADDGAGSVTVTVTHTAILSPFWDDFGPGAVGVGWETALLGLALHIADPDAEKPDEMEFVTSPEGRAYIEGSSEGWGQASIAAGTDADAAQAAARRVTGFYTGEPVEPA